MQADGSIRNSPPGIGLESPNNAPSHAAAGDLGLRLASPCLGPAAVGSGVVPARSDPSSPSLKTPKTHPRTLHRKGPCRVQPALILSQLLHSPSYCGNMALTMTVRGCSALSGVSRPRFAARLAVPRPAFTQVLRARFCPLLAAASRAVR
jgi:hypothetical protein